MMAPYEGTLRVQVTSIVADDERGFVSVRESAERPAEGLAWTGVHVWEFRGGKVARFESYYDDAYFEFWSSRSAPAPGTNG
jgi:ketosteroid isomerase-like protein